MYACMRLISFTWNSHSEKRWTLRSEQQEDLKQAPNIPRDGSVAIHDQNGTSGACREVGILHKHRGLVLGGAI